MRKAKQPGLGLSRKAKKAINTNTRLLRISENERQLLLGERVASILEKACHIEDFNVHLTDEKIEFLEIPKRLNKFRNQDCPLWTKASVLCEPEEEESYQQKLLESNRVKQLNTNISFIKLSGDDNPEPVEYGFKIENPLFNPEKSFSTSVTTSKSNSETGLIEKSSPNSSSEDGNESDVSRDLFESEPEIEIIPTQTPKSPAKIFPIFASSQKSSSQKKVVTKEGLRPCTSASASLSTSIMSKNITFDSDFETPKRMKENLFPRISLLETNGKSKSNQNQIHHQAQASTSITEWKPPPLSKSDHTDLGQDLLSLFLEKIDADLTVYGREEKAIRAHKLILKARCPKLLKEIIMEKTSKLGRKKEVIPLTCFSHTAVKSLLCYIYCGRILPPAFCVDDISKRDLDEIVELGAKYGLDLSVKTEPQSHSSGRQGQRQIKTQTIEVSMQTEVFIKEEKTTQTEIREKLDDLVKQDQAVLDEKAHEYRERSHTPCDNLNDAFGLSGNLFEESFNDKVFANKLVDDTVTKKGRKTWSDRSYKFSSNSNNGSDSDSIIILEDEAKQEDWDDEGNSDNEVRIEPPEARPASQPMQSSWNQSFDDFFANLPSDDKLLNVPPTSPTGRHTYTGTGGCTPVRRISPARSLGNATSSSQDHSNYTGANRKTCRKRKAKKNPDDLLEPQQLSQEARNPGKRISRARGKEPRIDNSYLQFESDDEDDEAAGTCSRVGRKKKSETGKNRNRTPISSSQGQSSRRSTSGSQNRNQQTPMLNYSLIDTPILKKELKRYGLKPLPRSKAKIMLRHIYKETHK